MAQFQHTCPMTDEYQRSLEELLHRFVLCSRSYQTRFPTVSFSIYFSVASQLEQHNFVVFLCYGSLWGEIRQSRLLPWALKAELCILEDHLIEYGYDDFAKDFKRNHMNIQYIAGDGYFYVESSAIDRSRTMLEPSVEIFVFAKDREVSDPTHSSGLMSVT